MMRTPGWGLTCGLAGALLLTGCSGGADAEPEPQARLAAEGTDSPGPVDPELCLKVSDRLAAAVLAGAEEAAGRLRASGAAAVRADGAGEGDLYWVAVELSGATIDAQVGLWATTTLKARAARPRAVDGTALEFTTWAAADPVPEEAEAGQEMARGCLARG